jgi:hypothetical protein
MHQLLIPIYSTDKNCAGVKNLLKCQTETQSGERSYTIKYINNTSVTHVFANIQPVFHGKSVYVESSNHFCVEKYSKFQFNIHNCQHLARELAASKNLEVIILPLGLFFLETSGNLSKRFFAYERISVMIMNRPFEKTKGKNGTIFLSTTGGTCTSTV